MMRVLLAFVAAALMIAPAAAQEEVLSKDLRAKSDREAERQARRDLDSLLEDFSGYKVGMRKLFAGDVWFWTDPRAGETRGMCERDQLQIFYRPANPDSNNSSTFTVKARSLASTRYYGFTETPSADTLERLYSDEARDTDSEDAKCRRELSDEWIGWFEAESPVVAVRGYLTLLAAREAVAAGAVRIDACEESSRRGSCLAEFDDALKLDALSEIRQFENTFRIDSGMTWITIEMKDPAFQPSAENVKSVKVEPYIVVT